MKKRNHFWQQWRKRKIIFRNINSADEIAQAGKLIEKQLICNFKEGSDSQIAYGNVAQEDIDILRNWGYEVTLAKAK